MASGLIALLDDVASLAKVAAASVDDITAQAAKAGTKAIGVVVDDAAVTPRYVTGFAAARELPIVGRIALGSLKNKMLFLLPGALALSLLAPWAITPLLMLGGLYLCFEGAEKVVHALFPGHHEEKTIATVAPQDAKALEEERVAGAIKTDFILSAEIMAITLATMPESSWMMQAVVLAVVGIGITLLVYGAVALIVKADDAGVSLALNRRPASTLLGLRRADTAGEPGGADRALRPLTRAIGHGLVRGMPPFLKGLALLGTAAMLWVGGGILLHGLEELGLPAPAHWAHDLAHGAAGLVPAGGAVLEWFVNALIAGLVGLAAGAAVIPLAGPLGTLARWIGGLFGGRKAAAPHAAPHHPAPGHGAARAAGHDRA